ncbi:MAG: CDP-diacylglycerol--serine O-phosphatidyltransferase [Terriglobia bacterium]
MEPQPPQPLERRGIRRGIYVLPSLFTVGTLVCGYYAILSTQRAGQFLAAAGAATLASNAADLGALAVAALDNASKAIGWAIVFDGLDGRIARLTNTASPFGRELDSLADVITFGVAPAVLAYVWGVRGLGELASAPHLQNIRDLAWILTFAYVICGASRLARFNIDTVKPTSDRRFFVGMPIPAGAGFVASVVHFYKQPLATWQSSLAWMLIVGILGYLMVSRMRYWSFKTHNLRKRRSYLGIIVIGLIIGGIWFYSEPVLLTLGVTYALSGIILRIISKIRPHPPAPEEVHAA